MTLNGRPPDFTFRIAGHPDDPYASPMPKQRLTRRQSWTPKAAKYQRWKDHVRAAFVAKLDAMDAAGEIAPELRQEIDRNLAVERRAFEPKPSHRPAMHVHVTWKDEHHGDPENVFGSIADALFKDDRHLTVACTFDHARDVGMRGGGAEVSVWLDVPGNGRHFFKN